MASGTIKGEIIGRGRTAEVFRWRNDRVLKLFFREISADKVTYEVRVTNAAHQAHLPVPAIDQTVEVEGRQGIVFERIDGPLLEKLMLSHPWYLPRLTALMADLHVKINSCQLPELPSRQTELGRLIQNQSVLPPNVRQSLIDQLRTLPDGDNLCHNDFHPQNIIMSPHGPVIIDWANAKRGNPLADVARTVLLLCIGTPPDCNALSRRFHTLGGSLVNIFYLRRYTELSHYSKVALKEWLAIVAAARLDEHIPEEKKPLLATVKKGYKFSR